MTSLGRQLLDRATSDRCGTRRSAPVSLAVAAACLALCGAPLALAGDPPPAPLWAADAGMRLDARVVSDGGVTDRRMTSPSMSDPYRSPSMQVPYAYGTPTAMQGTVQGSQGPVTGPWGPPAEVPDPRDFEQFRSLDELANPHYEIREEIWSTPEDFITRDGVGAVGGIGYVPYWARNTVRWGRFQFFPFVEVLGSWSSNLGETDDAQDGFEVVGSTGVLAQYLFPGGKSKFKAAARADYHWFSDELDDTFTYLGGLGIEHRISAPLTVDAGVEFERSQVLVSRDFDPTLSDEDDLVTRLTVYGNGRWDRFLTPDLRLEFGGSWSQNRGEDASDDILDYDEWMGYGRLGLAVIRHESFLYGEYRYVQRDVSGVGTDLDEHHEVRVGVDNIMPIPSTRRVVGNVYLGYAWEEYENGEEDDLITGGIDLTYRPDPYWSGYLSYVHQNTYSAISDFNREHEVTAAITHNLNHRLVARAATSWSRIEPDGRSYSDRVAAGVGIRWVVSDNVDVTADYEYAYRWEGAGLDEATEHRVTLGTTLHLR
jgi:hypothetical protein